MAQATVAQYSEKQKKTGLIAIYVLYFCVMFETYLLTVASPVMASDLGGMSMYSVLTTVPSLFTAMAMLIYGKLSDMYGRRVILIVSMAFFVIGSILCAIAPTFIFLVVARSILALGIGSVAPLCFSVLGDMFIDPAERGKWSGLINLPGGICALIGPTIGGTIIDSSGWRTLFWIGIPLAVIGCVMVLIGVPSLAQKSTHVIDFKGAVLVFFAIATMLLGFTWAGSTYPWLSFQVIGILLLSVVLWYIFLRQENKAEEPILDPQVLKNRTFMTAAMAGFFSIFMMMGIAVYYPLFLQGVQGTTASVSAQAVTPYNVLTAFMGIVAGMLLAKTGKYKWMYIGGYALLVVATIIMVTFNATTPLWVGIVTLTVAGFGLGAMPTVNTLVCQYSVPRRLMGCATGAVFFLVTIGMVIAPAIQGSVMNSTYASNLNTTLPAEVSQTVDANTMASLYNPNMLVSAAARDSLQQTFVSAGDTDNMLFNQTIGAVKDSMDKALRSINILSAAMMVLSLILVLTIPEISLGAADEAEQKKQAAAAAEAAK